MDEAKKPTILVVEDRQENRYLLSRLLTNAGYQVREAANGEEALRLAQDVPDLVLLDIELPDIDGFEVCKTLRGNPRTASLPVLHLSAVFVDGRDRSEGLDSGADMYLTWPVSPPELFAAVRALLRGRRAEKEARALARQWQSTFDAISEGICVLDGAGQVVRCNRAAGAVLGVAAEELIGQPWNRLLSVPEKGSPYARMLLSGRTESDTLPNGERWFRVTADPMHDEAGALCGAVYILADVTRTWQAEEALRSSEQRLAAILENTTAVVYLLDAQSRFLLVNRQFEKLFGVGRREVVGKSVYDVFPEESARQMEQNNQKVLAGGEALAFDETAPQEDGLHTYISIKVPLLDEAKRSFAICGISTDITDRNRMQEELHARAGLLEEADRRKDEFLAMLAHELRNPLAPMASAVEVVRLVGVDDQRKGWALDVLDRQLRYMARLVDDLLDVSRISRGKIHLRREVVPLAAVVEQAVEISRPAIEGRKHELALDLPPAPIQVEGDRTRLAQVLANLLNNAAKFTDRGGRIELRAELAGSEVAIRVRDNGMGMEPELLPRVFDLFTQGERSLDRSHGGLGIGLTLVRSLVEMHGGSVEAHSEGSGTGSEFVVRLPLPPEPAPQA